MNSCVIGSITSCPGLMHGGQQDPTSPLLVSPEAFKLYLACLVNTDQRASVFSAVRRRDSLLAAHHPAAAEASSAVASTTPSESPAPEGTETATTQTGATTSEVSKPLTSQAIAESVLAGPLVAPTAPSAATPPPAFVKLDGLGDKLSGDPIQVSIVERVFPYSLVRIVNLTSSLGKGSWIPRTIRFIAIMLVSSFCAYSITHACTRSLTAPFLVFLVILSVFFENSGLMKAGPRQSQFEPSEGKSVKFSDVHGVDEAKEVSTIFTSSARIHIQLYYAGTTRHRGFPKGPCCVLIIGRQAAEGRALDWVSSPEPLG